VAIRTKALLAILVALAVPQAFTQTRSLNIGSLQYEDNQPWTLPDGKIIQASAYGFNLDASAVAVDPITFNNVALFVKGSTARTKGPQFPVITTGPGCGTPGITFPCSVTYFGGPGLPLPACATLDAKTNTYVDNCVVIALQLTSLTGKNFTIALLNGETFCAYGITNVYLTAKADQATVGPTSVPNDPGFWKPASTPIILEAAPARSCD